MQFTGEITLGAIGIIVSIISTGLGGICTVVMMYAKTRNEIDGLKHSYAEVKVDLAKIEAKQEVQSGLLQALHVQNEKIATRLEFMNTMNGLPEQLATAMINLNRKNAA